MAKKQLSKSDIKEWNEHIKKLCGVSDFFHKKDNVELHDNRFLVLEGNVLFFIEDENPIPTLKLLQSRLILKRIVVDMGAVKFMAKGADVMRPGITHIDEGIAKDEYVVIVDENNKKPLCVGHMLFSGSDVKAMDSGKVIRNVHYVGDEIWNIKV